MLIRTTDLLRFASLTGLLLTACGDSRDTEHFVTRDSAGVTIVESSAPAWGGERRWVVDPDPVFSIGTFEGDPAYQLHRLSGVVRLGDGRIVLADGGSNQLRFFSPTGTHLRSTGGTGQGPGEFGHLFGVYRLPGDSLIALDLREGRVSLFAPDGEFVRIVEPQDPTVAYPEILGVGPDGTIVTLEPVESYSHLDLPSGFLREPVRLIRRSPGLAPLDTLTTILGNEFITVRGHNSATYASAPFLRVTSVSIRDDGLVIGEADGYELKRIYFDGRRPTSIRRSHSPRTLRTEDVDSVRNDVRPWVRQILHEIDFPSTYPPYAEVSSDSEGYLWVKDYPHSRGQEVDEWSIFSPEGEWLGHVEVPRTTYIAAIGADYILATTTDDLDVELVRLYRLRR
jgi:hypothetical protein